MSQLTEHLSKSLLAAWGLPIPLSESVRSPEQAVTVADRIGYPVMLKVQLPVVSRLRLGGVRRAENRDEAHEFSSTLFNSSFDELQPNSVLVEECMSVEQELYLGVTCNDRHRAHALIFSAGGGAALETHGQALNISIRPDGTLPTVPLRHHLQGMSLSTRAQAEVIRIAELLVRAYMASEARIVEVNPLGITVDGRVVALDARVVADVNALYRQPGLAALARQVAPRRPEDLVREQSRLEFVPLGGQIGLISGGAGMTMAVMDLIEAAGGQAACFLDCSANPTPSGFSSAINLVLRQPGVRSCLISIIGGLTLVDKVAVNFVDLIDAKRPPISFVFRLAGANAGRATQVLAQAGFKNYETIEEAVRAAVGTPGESAAS